MNEEAAFLKTIKKDPDDRTARLVFADWLQERDDPRAAWVRDDDVWQWMKPDAKDPTEKLIKSINRHYKYREACKALGKLGPAAVPAILRALQDDRSERQDLQWALSEIGPSAEPALPVLLEAMKDESRFVRNGAIQCLFGLLTTNAEARNAIIAAFDDDDPDIRNMAFTQCRLACKHPAVKKSLQAATPHLHDIIRGTAGTPWSGPRPHLIFRNHVLELLAQMEACEESLIPHLVSLLAHSVDGTYAGSALGTLGAPAVAAVLEIAPRLNEDNFWRAVWTLEKAGAAAIPLLQESLTSSDPATRRLAAVVLPKVAAKPSPGSVAALIEALRSSNGMESYAALEALKQLGPAGAEAIPTLMEMIEKCNDDPHIGKLGAVLLGMGTAVQATVPKLLEFASRKKGAPWWANWLLGELGHGVSGLILALARQDSGTLYLSDSIFDGVRETVEEAIRNDAERKSLREVAQLATRRPPAEAVEALLPFLYDDSQITRVIAVFALQHVGTPDAVAALLGALKNKDRCVRLCAVRALGRIGRGAAGVSDAIQAATKDRAKNVREAATKALAAQGAG